MERKTLELSCWLKPPRTKPKTHSFQSFVSWQFTVHPWHRHAGLWLQVSASEAAPSRVQHVMDLDNLKNYVLGWLMWQIGVTPQKYLAVDLKPSFLMYSKPLGMPSYVMALSSALITMHNVEVIRLAVMFTVSLHTTSIKVCAVHTGICCCGDCGLKWS